MRIETAMSHQPIIPVRNLLHPHLVDADGQIVKGKARAGLYAARETIPYWPKQHWSAPVCKNERLDYRPDLKSKLQSLEQSIFDISQVDIGADLLSAAYRMGVVFRFDKTECDRRKVHGYYSGDDNAVVLRGDLTGADLTLLLVHELEHAMHLDPKNRCTISDSLAALIHKSRIRENAAESVVGVFVYQVEALPEGLYRPKGLRQALKSHAPILRTATVAAKALSQENEWQTLGAYLFAGLAEDLTTAASYDLGRIAFVRQQIEKRKDKNLEDKSRLFSGPARPDTVLVRPFEIMGKKYVLPSMVSGKEFHQFMPGEGTKELRALRKEIEPLIAAGYSIDVSVPAADFGLSMKYWAQNLRNIVSKKIRSAAIAPAVQTNTP